MCANVLKDHDHQGKAADWLDVHFNTLCSLYQQALRRCLDHRGAVFLFAIAILGSLPVLISLAQRELAPQEDSSSLFVVATPPDYSNLDYINYFLDEMVAVWKDIPEISHSWQVNRPNNVFGVGAGEAFGMPRTRRGHRAAIPRRPASMAPWRAGAAAPGPSPARRRAEAHRGFMKVYT